MDDLSILGCTYSNKDYNFSVVVLVGIRQLHSLAPQSLEESDKSLPDVLKLCRCYIPVTSALDSVEAGSVQVVARASLKFPITDH